MSKLKNLAALCLAMLPWSVPADDLSAGFAKPPDTSRPHRTRDTELLPSGLLGPVRLLEAHRSEGR